MTVKLSDMLLVIAVYTAQRVLSECYVIWC